MPLTRSPPSAASSGHEEHKRLGVIVWLQTIASQRRTDLHHSITALALWRETGNGGKRERKRQGVSENVREREDLLSCLCFCKKKKKST